MIKSAKIIFLLSAFCIVTTIATADRGVFKKKINKIHLNIYTPGVLKNSIQFNLRAGLNYKGSTLLNQQRLSNSIFNTTLVSYEKGNTVYILPYKQKILIPEYTSSSGYKLIIRPRK